MSEPTSAPTKAQGYEPCEECGAPLDPQQRYCVECAARRGNGSNPSSRYFAAMSKKSRRPLTKSQAKKPGGGSRAAAVGFFALLPIAVALGVVVGRSGSGDSNEEALLKALRQAESRQVAAAPPAEEEATGTAATNGGKGSKSGGKTGGKKNKANDASKNSQTTGGGKNTTNSKQGAVEKIEEYEPSKQDVEEDTEIVENNPAQVGKTYIEAQQNLPEVTVVE
ncbi:MAG TPA: hypothetical protein VMH33_02120 [Solirubrobacterales bacterium]|nr:hypothetical protein [Solirubrobacterales bacterium]